MTETPQFNATDNPVPSATPVTFPIKFQHSSQEIIKLGCISRIDGILPCNTGHHRPSLIINALHAMVSPI